MGTFRAGVQYDDWRGTAAADSAFDPDISGYLKGKGLLANGEFVVSVEAWIGENNGGPSKVPNLKAFVAEAGDYETVKENLENNPDPLELRIVEFEMSFEDFFGLFKRFNFIVTRKGIDLENRSYLE